MDDDFTHRTDIENKASKDMLRRIGILKSITSSFSDRVLYASNNQDLTTTVLPIEGGDPIVLETAGNLQRLLFGNRKGAAQLEWMKGSFNFNDPKSVFSYGLISPKTSAKAVVMCIQAYILKHLLFKKKPGLHKDDLDEHHDRDINMDSFHPSVKDQQEALCKGIADVLWKAGSEENQCTVCMFDENVRMERDQYYNCDGLTEKLRLFVFTRYDDVYNFLFKYKQQFQQESISGVQLVVYSALLSRGIDKVIEDLSGDENHLLNVHGECDISLILLILTGRATPYLHNGTTFFTGKDSVEIPRTGIIRRSEIGFLMVCRAGNMEQEVGSRLKTPMLPIWVTRVDDHYGILFNPKMDLIRDHRAEHSFELYYYNSSPFQTEPVILSINIGYIRGMAMQKIGGRFLLPSNDKMPQIALAAAASSSMNTRNTKTKKEHSVPLLEKVILTKWQGASVKWNTATPIV